MPHRPAASNGIVIIDKPQGLTSNQVLGRVKRIFGTKKAGHTGTLDPMATGVLVVCLGHATRVAAHLLDADKAYEATLHLGVMTDTEDAEGEVIDTRPVPALSRDHVLEVLSGFLGHLDQVPPMYSALKHKGQRLYELARRGEEVKRPARQIQIYAIELIDWNLLDQECPGFSIAVHCSKGTYIRSLVRDIGEALGCGAHLCALRRIEAEPFEIGEAMTMEYLESQSREVLSTYLKPIESALPTWPRIKLDAQARDLFSHGRLVTDYQWEQEGSDEPTSIPSTWVIVRYEGECIGFGEIQLSGDIQPKAVFNTNS